MSGLATGTPRECKALVTLEGREKIEDKESYEATERDRMTDTDEHKQANQTNRQRMREEDCVCQGKIDS